ncbi:LuxR C-terminal-related transcriptional regulator [Saccharibacillus sp. CPCC 101409]|uniref:helix-turn-helix transcriptional regulator n=1 Tax=Saccharibacillus sp. CPCC 101409 TaxID=3058041 RepID=UPI002672CF6C|nr:helix-turn-helix transcriptional regulator [Saccharibacillus sp. CPCC 101409]MDO3409717.1 LuxR C-terminal-related transcriptional regulator [Saccharibacillus sp. CPCC 101409]
MIEFKPPFAGTAEEIDWIKQTSDCYFIIDENGEVLYWSAELGKLLDIPALQTVGKTCRSLDLFSDCSGKSLCKNCKVLSAAKYMKNCNGSRTVFFKSDSVSLPLQKYMRASSYDKRLIWITLEQISAFPFIKKLTSQEIKVLALLSKGYTAQHIAIELHIAYTTVRTHIRNLLSKLEVHNQKEAVALFFAEFLK